MSKFLDLLILPDPIKPNDALKVGVSHNRLVDSVRSGCVPVASEMPSYLE